MQEMHLTRLTKQKPFIGTAGESVNKLSKHLAQGKLSVRHGCADRSWHTTKLTGYQASSILCMLERVIGNKHIQVCVWEHTYICVDPIGWGCLRTGFWEEYFDPRGMMWRENGGSCTVRNFIICTHPQILLGRSSQGEWGGRDMWNAWNRKESVQGFGGKARRKETTRKMMGVWTGLDWLMLLTSGELFWMLWWNFGFLLHGLVSNMWET
jgi:hypothetical protein